MSSSHSSSLFFCPSPSLSRQLPAAVSASTHCWFSQHSNKCVLEVSWNIEKGVSSLLALGGHAARPPETVLTGLSRQNSGKSIPSCFLISDVFPLTPVSVLVTLMEDECEPSSEVMSNSTEDRLFNHEIVFTEREQTHLDRLEVLSS